MGVNLKKYNFKIEGLDCANCANELERALQKIDIIDNVVVNFMTEKLIFECEEEDRCSAIEQIKKVIKKEEDNVIIKELNPYE